PPCFFEAHMATCCFWADSHSTSAIPAALFLASNGTPSQDPPQLVAPPGSTGATAHLPAYASPAWPWMYPIIQVGQARAANAPLLKALFQVGENCSSPAVMFASAADVAWFQAASTPSLPSTSASPSSLA